MVHRSTSATRPPPSATVPRSRRSIRASPRSAPGRRSARPHRRSRRRPSSRRRAAGLGFSPKRTMSIAQRLYEGIETGEGQVGLITYMRTDSTAIAGVAMGEAREVIGERYGPTYTMPKGRVYKTKSKGAQEAHESIRPTSFRRDPDSLAGSLKPDELRLYRLIWQRALASQMAPKELETTTIELADGAYELRASATKVLFDGFARVYTEGRDDDATDEDDETGRLPALAEGDPTTVDEVTPTQHFTEPPPRFTEATLIKALEEHGIGRPSTYAATISTIVDRGYVRVEERRLHPELVAEIVTDLLVEHFGDYVDVAFTARMEEELDEVARGERAWVPLLRAFYGPLRDRVDEKRRELKRSDFTTEATDEVCSLGPSDGHPARPERALPRLLAVSRAQGEPAAAGRRAAAPGGDGRGLPEVRRGDARRQERPVRAVRRLLALSRLRLHQEGRPAAARPAPVRGDLPQEQRRAPRAAPGPPDRQRLLGLLELPALRLHDQPRTARRPARHRRRPAGPQGPDRPVPGLRLGERDRAGRDRARASATPAAPRTPRRSRDRRVPEAARAPVPGPRTQSARPRSSGARGGPVEPRPGNPTNSGIRGSPSALARSSRPPTRERGAGQSDDRSCARAVPSLPRRPRRLAAHAAGLRDRGRGVPRLVVGARDGLAPTGPRRPARLSGDARPGPCAVVRRAAAGRHPVVPSLGDPQRPRAR